MNAVVYLSVSLQCRHGIAAELCIPSKVNGFARSNSLLSTQVNTHI
jgi:hypothetical protein